ncbi:DegT/DnrJ/EryC1/StrS family aminotransferase [Bacillus inaquosorum]|uniref:DegT/DnrJ/EryC1/StrS family aminotransferase n=1 Tax=Bacillus inaquosorum TaxID=483913 RepID=UPI00227E5E26|nr:DegT/DnrJ/EryC1/StrS family aminotransferase [Bacillus inaquosorum]MCY7902831.1 DegT/DnrJ/EryC1/StrS family aminotransferase [Bacillus inaquosorum]MCY8262195.1 DegT/DnrJ/EryC1/StrS family aminotransferase [Bacillus inaquosorum]MCY8284570.1 DegT/DnrJ/EryC1/StrS family aminotransferase [Bacillus inaquosorum]MCY9453473.1 DegT/DnrJ/EryC1/StrS family aminotransferase [Bacillus inaquosorum]
MIQPYQNYQLRYKNEKERIKSIVYEAGLKDQFILKEKVARLEEKIKGYTGAPYAVAVSNGTSALIIILKALGVKPGVDVLTPAFSFIATASCISLLGGNPIFVDIDKETGMIDPDDVKRKMTPSSRVIIAAHLFSVMADMKRLRDIADEHGLFLVEDSAVALGGTIDGVSAGLLGDIGLYSFFPAKPIGGIGDGGMIVTKDDELAARCKMLRNHGQEEGKRFYHTLIGYNYRMDELVADFISQRLEQLEQIIEKRGELAELYHKELAPSATYVSLPPKTEYQRVYYTYLVQAEYRDELQSFLEEKGIETVVFYPLAIHEQKAYQHLGHQQGDFPNAEQFARKSLAFPLYPEMRHTDVRQITERVNEFYAAKQHQS